MMWSELDKEQLDHESYAYGIARSWPAEEIEQLVVFERIHRYNHALPCGAAALRRRLDEHYCVRPLPSVRAIGRILTAYGLTHGRLGWCQGEDPDWLPVSARIPEAKRKRFSFLDPMGTQSTDQDQ
jgi:hypothetical protein